MYKLLIVDDEEIEREGMEHLIPWEKYGIKLVGSAWNGVEGLEKIREQRPDIVLTDVKMPVMDGIELIRSACRSFPDMEFVVLSGYGEYEFTSRAMEEGVRHYILKPCDEQKIAAVLGKVEAELEEKRKNRKEDQYQSTVLKLLPRAKEQLFRNMLLGREQLKQDYRLLREKIGPRKVVVLAFRMQKGFDDLEQFAIGNILSDLLGKDKVLLSASIQKDALLLLDARAGPDIGSAAARTVAELKELETFPVQAAVSRTGRLEDVGSLYVQVQSLFGVGSVERQIVLLREGIFRDPQNDATLLVNYQAVRDAKEYEEILFEIYLAFVKMDQKRDTLQQKRETCRWIVKILCGGEDAAACPESGDGWSLMEWLTDLIAEKEGLGPGPGKEEQRLRKILLAVYRNIRNPGLNVHYLSQNVLFMNEDYFGRLFLKSRKEKFSAFLERRRIALAQRLLQYDPEFNISRLAETVGYSPDGQYFSKIFRKTVGMSPTEYRDSLKE